MAWCAVMFVMFWGCGDRSNQPELGQVHGKILLNGKPLAKVTVSFKPIDGGRQSNAATDEDGLYELIYLRDIRGAKTGKHRVAVGSSDPTTPKRERLPDRYNAKTTLEAEVRPGENQCDFALNSP
jgi:hypothetical protein